MIDAELNRFSLTVEEVVSAKIEALKNHIAGLFEQCATKASVKEEVDGLKAAIAASESRLHAEHDKLLDVLKQHGEAAKARAGAVDAIGRGLDDVKQQCAVSFLETNERAEAFQVVLSSFSGNDQRAMAAGVVALKEWAGKSRASLVYDSRADPFTPDGLFAKIRDRPNVALITCTTDGDVFGCFYTMPVKVAGKSYLDPNMFIFSFESHGRCATPQRFMVKADMRGKADVYVRKSTDSVLVSFGKPGGCSGFTREKVPAVCRGMSTVWEGIQDTTLTGRTAVGKETNPFFCARVVALQLA